MKNYNMHISKRVAVSSVVWRGESYASVLQRAAISILWRKKKPTFVPESAFQNWTSISFSVRSIARVSANHTPRLENPRPSPSPSGMVWNQNPHPGGFSSPSKEDWKVDSGQNSKCSQKASSEAVPVPVTHASVAKSRHFKSLSINRCWELRRSTDWHVETVTRPALWKNNEGNASCVWDKKALLQGICFKKSFFFFILTLL